MGSKTIPDHPGLLPNKKLRRKLRAIMGFSPGNLRNYKHALIHRSATITGKDGNPVNNERLEFLGDAILDAVVSDYLFHRFPDQDEGMLSRLRSGVVRRETLNQLAGDMGLRELVVSHTESNRNVKHLWGNSFEALIGAMYLDKGLKKTRKFIVGEILKKHLDPDRLMEEYHDYKSQLIEWGQKNRSLVEFSYLSNDSPNRDTNFTTRISIDGKPAGEGTGSSKKESEQEAAKNAWEHIENS